MNRWRYPRYVPVWEKRAKAEIKLEKLKKKHPDIRPVVVEGRAIAKTWWGRSWNDNLERYADYANRIGRGRSYVRNGAVLDLRIESGTVIAMVQGSRAKPYDVHIQIKALGKHTWAGIKAACAGKFDSLQDLLAGKFPQALSDMFTARGKGLFPSPDEIEFGCSCPDWAVMCKHVAATLYGVGARLDEDPALFFTLRNVQVADLVAEAMQETTEHLLKKAETKRGPVIAEADLENLFGIVLEDQGTFAAAGRPDPVPSGSRSRKPQGKQKPTASPVREVRDGGSGADDRARVLDRVAQSTKGVDVPALKAQTGLDAARIRGIVYAACKKGIIEKAGRGVFRGKIAPADPAKDVDAVLALVRGSQKGIGVPEILNILPIPAARVRSIIARACARADIIRVSRGKYAGRAEPAEPVRAGDAVLEMVGNSPLGIAFPLLLEKSGMADKQLRNAVHRLLQQGKIVRVRRGVYAAAKKRKR